MLFDNGRPRDFFNADPAQRRRKTDRIVDTMITAKGVSIIVDSVNNYLNTPHPVPRIRRTLGV